MTPILGGILLGTGALVWGVLVAWVVAALARRIAARSRLDVRGRWVLVTGCGSGFGLDALQTTVDPAAPVTARG